MSKITPEEFQEWREGRLEDIGRAEDEVGHMNLSFNVELVPVKLKSTPLVSYMGEPKTVRPQENLETDLL